MRLILKTKKTKHQFFYTKIKCEVLFSPQCSVYARAWKCNVLGLIPWANAEHYVHLHSHSCCFFNHVTHWLLYQQCIRWKVNLKSTSSSEPTILYAYNNNRVISSYIFILILHVLCSIKIVLLQQRKLEWNSSFYNPITLFSRRPTWRFRCLHEIEMFKLVFRLRTF